MATKKLSIITINYNNKNGLLKTLKSVVEQSFRDFELIIIDGGSHDGSYDILKEFSDKIDYWISEPDKGIYNAMNKGVAVAQGEYCNFMNSGDCFYGGDILERVFKSDPIADICIGKAKTPQRIILPPRNPTFNYFFTRKSINHQAAFIKRYLLIKYPYEEINLKIVSDWKFFFDALIKGNCSYMSLDEFIVKFDDSGIGSKDIEFNISEQSNLIRSLIYPRIIEDYENIRDLDSPFIKTAVTLGRISDRYGRFLNPSKYYRKVKKSIKTFGLFLKP